jgi:hypothetical protein
MKQNIPQMRNMLNDVVEHFSSNPFELRSNSNSGCFYNPPKDKPNSIGCAIGMYLPSKICSKIEGHSINLTINTNLFNLLPKWMQKMDNYFLISLQSLHDKDDYWNDEGLTAIGKNKVEEINNYLDKLALK